MSQNLNSDDGEIEISELFKALWAHKLFITLLTGLSIFYSGYNALTTEKFTANSIFQIEDTSGSSGFNLLENWGFGLYCWIAQHGK